MSLYIQPDNQQLLWNTVQKIPNFQSIPHGDKEIWFKNIVKRFYEVNKDRKLYGPDLKELNKQTIQYMVQTLNSNVLNQNTNQNTNQNNINYTISENNNTFQNPSRPIQPVSELKGNRKEGYTMEFANRQKEYENMMKRDVPPEPNFKEGIEDKAIENMEELLQQQMRQRELDIHPMGGLPPPRPKAKRVKIVEKLDLSGGNVPIELDEVKTFHLSNDIVTRDDLLEFNKKIDILFELINGIHTKMDIMKHGLIMEFNTIKNKMGIFPPIESIIEESNIDDDNNNIINENFDI